MRLPRRTGSLLGQTRLPWLASLPTTVLLATVLLAASPAAAQREGYSYLSFVGSDVSLVSRGEDDTTARLNSPVMAGDRLATGSSSRAEAVLADGGILRVDARSTIRFDRLARTWESEDDRTLVALERGALALETRGTASRELAPRVDTDDATILLPDRALVRVDAGRRGTELYVVEGRAEMTTRSGRSWVSAGEYAWASGEEAVEVSEGGLPRDRFTRFLEERRERPAASSGVRYVASDYAYDYESAQLDSYGSWDWVPSYNSYCWRPVVGSDWSPYSAGYWRWTPAGMTWVSSEPWGWLPYHYGSWCFEAAFGWCWMPGSYYSPAWVYWSYQPGWVGWCPMGYYGGYTPWWGAATAPGAAAAGATPG